MKIQLAVMTFVLFLVVNGIEGIYLWRLAKNRKQAQETVAFLGPLAEQEETQEIETLGKNSSDAAVDRLVRYGKRTRKKSVAMKAITSLKKIGTPHALEELSKLLKEDNADFVQDMAALAYQAYGSKEDVPTLREIHKEVKTRTHQEQIDKLIELLKNRDTKDIDTKKVFSLIEIRDE